MDKAPSMHGFDVIVVGGGAAGFFAALTCKECAPELRIGVVEQSQQVLSKVRISGGGRCNVTHACFDPRELAGHYPRGSRELIGPFHFWQCRDTMNWFSKRGVALKTESDGRVFPVSDDSMTIVQCLMKELDQAGVHLRVGEGVRSVDCLPGETGFRIETTKDQIVHCQKLLLATGGMKEGAVKRFLEGQGHHIAPLAPSLFTFHVAKNAFSGLPGVAVDQVEVTLPGTDFKQCGPLLFTHQGLSGPAIIKCSAWAARWIMDRKYRFQVRINWKSDLKFDDCLAELKSLKSRLGSKLVRNQSCFDLPRRLWERLVLAAGIKEETSWAQLNLDQCKCLTDWITGSLFQVTGKSMNKDEFVTCGGVALNEVQFKTMESRLVKGLHFAGEILDIDGITGGFNFQNAWTTGRIAGIALASKD